MFPVLARRAAQVEHRVEACGAGGGLVAGVPWLAHVWRHQAWLHVTSRTENITLEFVVGVVGLAVVGAWHCLKIKTRSAKLHLALWLGFCVMAYPFTFRWVSGEGMLPTILLAGVGLEQAVRWLARHWRVVAVPSVGLAVFSAGLLLSPSVAITQWWNVPWWLLGKAQPRSVVVEWLWPDAALFHLTHVAAVKEKGMDISFYGALTERLAHSMGAVSQPGEILWSNSAYGGGLIAIGARRPLSTAMFYEVQPARPFDPIGAAHWLVWFKLGALPGVPPLREVLARYPLQRVLETDLAIVFRNPQTQQLAHAPERVMPWWLAQLVVGVGIGLVIWDIQRQPS